MTFKGPDQYFTPDDRAALTARSRITADVLDCWLELRRLADQIPFASDVDASLLGPSLPYVFTLEQLDGGIARFRVAGHHLNDLMGMETRAMPITAFAAPGERTRLLPLVDRVFEDPAIVELDLIASRDGHEAKEAEMLLLPLRNRHGKVTRAIGCLVARGPILFTPYRFRIRGSRVAPATVGADPARRTGYALAEDPIDFEPKRPAHGGRAFKSTLVPYLKIVE